MYTWISYIISSLAWVVGWVAGSLTAVMRWFSAAVGGEEEHEGEEDSAEDDQDEHAIIAGSQPEIPRTPDSFRHSAAYNPAPLFQTSDEELEHGQEEGEGGYGEALFDMDDLV